MVIDIWVFLLQYGETPLHMAAKNGSSEAARVLLDHGALVESKANVSLLVLKINYSVEI